MTKHNEIRALEVATIDLLMAIQKGETSLSDKIYAVNEALDQLLDWKIEVYEEVSG